LKSDRFVLPAHGHSPGKKDFQEDLSTLELKPFKFHGYLGNRRVTSFGLRYDYSRRQVEAAHGFPSFMAELRNKVAEFSGRHVEDFQQGGVNEYPPGAGIGWHKDKPQFGVIVGVSLLSSATMRFRLLTDTGWLHRSQTVGTSSSSILQTDRPKVLSIRSRKAESTLLYAGRDEARE
jgi:hypothetical protein